MCDSQKRKLQTTMTPNITVTKTHPLFHNPYGKLPTTIPPPNKPITHTPKYHQQFLIPPVTPLTPDTNAQDITKGNNCRICYINANGLITADSDRLCEITKYMLEHNVDIFGISETNLNTSNINTYQSICKQMRTH